MVLVLRVLTLVNDPASVHVALILSIVSLRHLGRLHQGDCLLTHSKARFWAQPRDGLTARQGSGHSLGMDAELDR